MFIKLTAGGNHVYVNSKYIVAVRTFDKDTRLWVAGDEEPFKVRESPEQIVEMVSLARSNEVKYVEWRDGKAWRTFNETYY